MRVNGRRKFKIIDRCTGHAFRRHKTTRRRLIEPDLPPALQCWADSNVPQLESNRRQHERRIKMLAWRAKHELDLTVDTNDDE